MGVLLQKWASQGNNYLASDWTTILGWSLGQAQHGYGYSNEQYNTYYGYMNSTYFKNWYSQLQLGQRTDWDQFWKELEYNNQNNLPVGDYLIPFVFFLIIYIIIYRIRRSLAAGKLLKLLDLYNEVIKLKSVTLGICGINILAKNLGYISEKEVIKNFNRIRLLEKDFSHERDVYWFGPGDFEIRRRYLNYILKNHGISFNPKKDTKKLTEKYN